MGTEDLGRYWLARQISRRHALRNAAIGAAAVGAIGVVGCSSGDDDDNGGSNGGNGSSTPGPETVNDGTQDGPGKPGGILRVRQNPALPSLNPFGPGIFALAQQLTLGFTVFDHMWYVPTDTGVTELFLATELEQPSDLELIATIGDAVFQDKGPAPGRAVEAEDIVQSYLRYKEEAPIGYSWLHNVLDKIEAVDTHTVKFTQKFPWAWIFTSSNAGSPISSSILPREVLHDNDDFLQRDAVGSGHWILDSHENGANLKLRKFPNFRQFAGKKDITGQPFLDGVDFAFIADSNAAHAAFVDNQLDTFTFSNKKQADDTIAQLGNRIVVGEDLSRDYVTLMITYKDARYKDVRIRQGLNKMLDRDEAVLLLEDGNAIKAAPVPPAHERYQLPEDDSVLVDWFTSDPAEGKAMLEAAGWDFDHEVVLKHSNRPVDSELAQVLKAQLARGDVKVRLEQEDLVKWFSQTLNQGDFEMTCFQHLPYEDPDLPLRFYMADPASGISNFMGYNEPKVTDACLAAARELDEEKRIALVQEAQRVIMREAAPMMNILSKINYAARYDYVKGAITGRGTYGLFNRTNWLDKA